MEIKKKETVMCMKISWKQYKYVVIGFVRFFKNIFEKDRFCIKKYNFVLGVKNKL